MTYKHVIRNKLGFSLFFYKLSSIPNKRKKNNHLSGHPFVLMIVMLPFPPSVRIFVLPTIGLPENADVGYDIAGSSYVFLDFDGGGVRIFLFMSFRVTDPSPHGFTNANGRTTDDVTFVGVFMKDFFPVYHKNGRIRLLTNILVTMRTCYWKTHMTSQYLGNQRDWGKCSLPRGR